MLKQLLTYLLLLVSLTAFCQTPPVWFDPAMRDLKYPKDTYFTGFSIGEREPGESNDAAVRRISDAAKVEAASSIRMTVSKVMNTNAYSSLITGSNGMSEVSAEEFSSSTTMQIGIKDIPGLLSEVWTDPKKGTIAAFAYVGKSELLRKVDRRLTVNMTKLEMSVEELLKLVEAGRFKDAEDSVKASLDLAADVEEDQKLLISIDEKYSDEDLQIQRFNELKKSVLSVSDSLKDGVPVFLCCSAEIFGNAYPEFEKEIKASLSKLQCHLVESPENAERIIELNASATEHSKSEIYNFRSYFCYVNVDIKLNDTAKGICLYEGRLSQKGSHTSCYDEAAKNGYGDIIGKVIQVIEEHLL